MQLAATTEVGDEFASIDAAGVHVGTSWMSRVLPTSCRSSTSKKHFF
jgi:hypothetical protein